MFKENKRSGEFFIWTGAERNFIVLESLLSVIPVVPLGSCQLLKQLVGNGFSCY